MDHREKLEALYASYGRMMDAVGKSRPVTLPVSVDRAKLEAAYDMLKDYEFVLKRKASR